MPEPWEKWWCEARDCSAVAGEMLAAGRYSHATFFAVQAMEMAAKAMVAAPVTWDELASASWEQASLYSWDQLATGMSPPRTHDLEKILSVPWVQSSAREDLLRHTRRLEQSLGVRDRYMAARYPDQWPEDAPPPSRVFSADHAMSAMSAMGAWMYHCGQRFRKRSTPGPSSTAASS